MHSVRRIVLQTGIVGGLLFGIHASIPYCGAWPMIWPAFAGAVSFWLATRDAMPHRLRTGLAAACLTAVITGALAFVAMSTAVYVSLQTFAAPTVKQTGVPTGFITSVSIFALATLAAIDVVVAVAGGVLMLPVRYFQTRHAHV